MGIIRKIVLFTAFAVMGGAALAAFPAERAYAGQYDISTGGVTIKCTASGNTVNDTAALDDAIEIHRSVPGNPSSHSITIDAARDCTAKVKLNDVNIDLSSGTAAAVSITGDGKAVIELVGTNTLKSGYGHAGIEKNNSGSLEICGTGSLTVTGGNRGAGIGGENRGAGSNITITGGTVTAFGGNGGAGIGGGDNGAGSDITITGGTVSANGGDDAAGIGGGNNGAGSKITITGGEVTATGNGPGNYTSSGAGIGGGSGKDGFNITITGGTVIATGGSKGAAGIGSGSFAAGSDITISGGTVTASGGAGGAGIGGGKRGGSCSGIRISKDAKVMAAGGGSAYDSGTGAAIGCGSKSNDISGVEVDPDISGLYTTGFIKKYTAGSSAAAMNDGTAKQIGDTIWGTVPVPGSEPVTEPDTVITVSDNKPMSVSSESKGDFKITYAHEIPFFGKGKITPEYFGGLTVSQGDATYNVTKIKVNKKKLRIQITGLQGADKDTVKKIKKATKGNNGLPFKCNPYYVRDTDKVTPKFKKNGDLKSVKILINNKDYKAKKGEFSYDSVNQQILFTGSNLGGSYQCK